MSLNLIILMVVVFVFGLFIGKLLAFLVVKIVEIKINVRLFETITSMMILILFIKYGFTSKFLKFAVLICFLIVIGVIDYYTTDVYFITVFSGLCTGIVFLIGSIIFGINNTNYIYLLIIVSFIAIVALLGNIGWGDVEVIALCGIYLDEKSFVLMLILAFIIGGMYCALFLLKKNPKDKIIPFCPCIMIASFITIIL